jgi:hypothetical protein
MQVTAEMNWPQIERGLVRGRTLHALEPTILSLSSNRSGKLT